jgi:chromate transporter
VTAAVGGGGGSPEQPPSGVSLPTIARRWTRIGCTGFGGPPAHLTLLRRMCVDERRWMTAHDFEDGVAVTNLLPGPASTQMAIYCAWRLRGAAGAVVGGICFISPGLALIILLAAVFLAGHPPSAVVGAAAGAGAAVPAVALAAALGFAPASLQRTGAGPRSAVRSAIRSAIRSAPGLRWVAYALVGAVTAATVGTYLVIALVACGLVEVVVRRARRSGAGGGGAGGGGAGGSGAGGPGAGGRGVRGVLAVASGHALAVGGIGALIWVAFKVGALSYGGGFVIVPLMQHDAVSTYHWMTGTQFLGAVALGQVTPGPVVQTVAVIGYAAAGVPGALLAAAVAFAPSFGFVIGGGPHFDRIRESPPVQSFFRGAGPAVVGAIAGSAVPLALAFQHLWQVAVLAVAFGWLVVLRRSAVIALLAAGVVGAVLAVAGVAT